MENKTYTEDWQKVAFARKQGCNVTNKDGYKVVEVDSKFGSELKVYSSFPMYYMSSTDSEELLFDGKPYDEWWANHCFDFSTS